MGGISELQPVDAGVFHRDSGDPAASHDQHIRGMSSSLPQRRSKLWLSTYDMQRVSQQTDKLVVDDTLNHGRLTTPNLTRGHSHSSTGSLKGLLRKASMTLRGKIQRRSSMVADHKILEEPASLPRPTTASSTWNRLRQSTTLRHSRSLFGLNVTQEPISMAHSAEATQTPIPALGDEPPVIPRNTGAAAKAFAVRQNDYLADHGFQTRWFQPAPVDEGNDRESGIGIMVTLPESGAEAANNESILDQDGSISRVDFVARLPVEVAIEILSYLDAAALSKSSLVCHHWHYTISNPHVWRESCLRETTNTYATSGPIRPNAGQGIPRSLPSNDWKQIYRIKRDLNQRWKSGKARPVYLNGHTDSVYCLQFDEHKIVSGSRDRTVRVWDMHTLECRLVVGPLHVIGLEEVMVDEKGDLTHFATGPDNIKSAASRPILSPYSMCHDASILCLQYDDEILVTGSSDATSLVYDVASGYRPIRKLRGHTAAVLDLVFDKKHIVTCSKDISICVWDRETGALLRQLRGHTGPVNAVQMRGNTIVSCSGDFKVKLWNIDTGKNIREFVGHTKGLACSQFSEDGRYVASAGNDKVIRIWDANTGECVREMRAHEHLVRSLHIDSVSGRLVSASYDTDIKVWDMETGHQLLDFPRWHASWVLSAKSDYRRIVSTGQDPKILIMDFGAEVPDIEMLESDEGSSLVGCGGITKPYRRHRHDS